jgi:ribosome biogenesis GTPase
MNHPLDHLGWDDFFAEALASLPGPAGEVGRVIAQHRGVVTIRDAAGEHPGELPGRLRRAIERGEALHPTVGDWVIHAPRGDGTTLVHGVLPRRTHLSRKAAGREVVEQVVAANVDVVLVVLPVVPEPSPRLLERYLAMIRAGGAAPVVVLSKRDLREDADRVAAELAAVAGDAPVHLVTRLDPGSVGALLSRYLAPGRTAALVGPSGAGKSTLVNHWLGEDRLAVGEVQAGGKGRHTTTRRELFALPGGGLVIDTPGMRELGLWGDAGTLDVFDDVAELGAACRFSDCRHQGEPGCAVEAAVAEGRIPEERVAAFRKLQREQAALEAQQTERARAAKKASDKERTRALHAFQRRRGR